MIEQPQFAAPLTEGGRAPRLTKRRAGLAGAGVLLAGAVTYLFWPAAEEEEYTVVGGDMHPERPADYLFRLRKRIAPLRSLVRTTPVPTLP